MSCVHVFQKIFRASDSARGLQFVCLPPSQTGQAADDDAEGCDSEHKEEAVDGEAVRCVSQMRLFVWFESLGVCVSCFGTGSWAGWFGLFGLFGST